MPTERYARERHTIEPIFWDDPAVTDRYVVQRYDQAQMTAEEVATRALSGGHACLAHLLVCPPWQRAVFSIFLDSHGSPCLLDFLLQIEAEATVSCDQKVLDILLDRTEGLPAFMSLPDETQHLIHGFVRALPSLYEQILGRLSVGEELVRHVP